MEDEMAKRQDKKTVKMDVGETAKLLARLKEIPYNGWECKTEGDIDIPAEENCTDLPKTEYLTSTIYCTRTDRFTAELVKERHVTFRQHSYYNRLFDRMFDLQEYSLILSAGEYVFVANRPAAKELFEHLQKKSGGSSQRASLLDSLLGE